MKETVINLWTWQDKLGYMQGMQVKSAKGTLYVSGKAAVLADDTSSNDDMRTQLGIAIQDLEKVISWVGLNYTKNPCTNLFLHTYKIISTQRFQVKMKN